VRELGELGGVGYPGPKIFLGVLYDFVVLNNPSLGICLLREFKEGFFGACGHDV